MSVSQFLNYTLLFASAVNVALAENQFEPTDVDDVVFSEVVAMVLGSSWTAAVVTLLIAIISVMTAVGFWKKPSQTDASRIATLESTVEALNASIKALAGGASVAKATFEPSFRPRVPAKVDGTVSDRLACTEAENVVLKNEINALKAENAKLKTTANEYEIMFWQVSNRAGC